MAARLSCSTTFGAYSYQQNPQNEYLLLHAQPAWDTLNFIWGQDGENNEMAITMDNMFNIACGDCPSGILKECADISFPDPCVVDTMSLARSKYVSTSLSSKKRKKSNQGNPVITFVTGNRKKLEEVQRILSQPNDKGKVLPFTISNKKVDLPELQGDPVDIAKEKCALAANDLGCSVITEDTSLCFNALQNLPGPYIKWFLEKCGHQGLNDMIAFTDDKSGYAQTIVGFCAGPGKGVHVFDGRTDGNIVMPRGSMDFGWDSIFEPLEGGGCTYAEMSKDQKDGISHRSRAFKKFRLYLENESDSISKMIQTI